MCTESVRTYSVISSNMELFQRLLYPVRHRCVRVRSGNQSGGKKWQTFKECVPFLE